MAKYGYGKQMAFYQRGLREITGEWFAPIIVAIEKEPPHLIGLYSLDADSLQHCRDWVQDKLTSYHSWLKQPKGERRMGYDPRIFEVRLPQWAFYVGELIADPLPSTRSRRPEFMEVVQSAIETSEWNNYEFIFYIDDGRPGLTSISMN